MVVESDVDALPSDDRWYAVLGAPQRLRVLRIVESRGAAPVPRFTSLALDPLQDGSGGFLVEGGTPASLLTLTRGHCDVVILEDIASLSGDAEAKLRGFLREGGGLVVALGPHADPDYYGQRLFPASRTSLSKGSSTPLKDNPSSFAHGLRGTRFSRGSRSARALRSRKRSSRGSFAGASPLPGPKRW